MTVALLSLPKASIERILLGKKDRLILSQGFPKVRGLLLHCQETNAIEGIVQVKRTSVLNREVAWEQHGNRSATYKDETMRQLRGAVNVLTMELVKPQTFFNPLSPSFFGLTAFPQSTYTLTEERLQHFGLKINWEVPDPDRPRGRWYWPIFADL